MPPPSALPSALPGDRPLDLVGLGECMVELFAEEPLGTAHTFTRAHGGDVLNALVAASRLGSKTGFVSRVGDDPFGEGLLAAWRAEGVDTGRSPLVPGENGVYFISLLPGGEREFTYRRTGSAASGLAPQHLEPDYLASSRCVLLSGITQAISESARAATLEAARLARAAGTLVAYDPNHRPRLWATRGGLDAARAAFLELSPLVDVLLPSFPADVSFLAPGPLPLEEAARFMSGFAPLVALKAGARGAALWAEGRLEVVPAVTGARAVDSTGAGDAWNGAFLHHLLAGRPLMEAVRLAHEVAAAALGHRGAIPPKEGR